MSVAEEPALPAAKGQAAKGSAAFRTIGEVAGALDLPAHVLRFWEEKFPQLRPVKRGGGRRYYRPEDVALLRQIRDRLYRDGYTIRGVQQLLQSEEPRPPMPHAGNNPPLPLPLPLQSASDEGPAPEKPSRRPRRRTPVRPETRAALEDIRRELVEARALLETLLQRPKPL